MAVVKSDLEAYHHFLKQYNDDPLQVRQPVKGPLSRAVADMVIIAKALHLGGYDGAIDFLVTPNTKRATMEVSLGNAVIGAQQLATTAIGPGEGQLFFVSAPVTRYGEFHKVIYTTEDREDVLSAESAEDLNATGPGIIGIHWAGDEHVLNDMGISNLRTCATFESMVRMVVAGRARWIPLEASSSPDLCGFMQGTRFVPVPGVKFALPESRHFLVSRQHPAGARVFAALEKGLAKLRKQGFIRHILTASGFFNPKIASWKLLNQDALDQTRQ